MNELPLDQAIALKADQAFALEALQHYLDAVAPSIGKLKASAGFLAAIPIKHFVCKLQEKIGYCACHPRVHRFRAHMTWVGNIGCCIC